LKMPVGGACWILFIHSNQSCWQVIDIWNIKITTKYVLFNFDLKFAAHVWKFKIQIFLSLWCLYWNRTISFVSEEVFF
jgi:hypothetical protein